jgi:predicted DsbA family dithiol-disulfide isomerase
MKRIRILTPVKISYYSDVLCIWAYLAQRRVDQLTLDFGDRISIDVHYCSVFPDVFGKMETSWATKGGFEGFHHHIHEVAQKFPHIEVHPRLWLDTRPRTSASAHMFLKAVEQVEQDQSGKNSDAIPYQQRLSTRAAWALRLAFFANARDISDWQVLAEIAGEIGVDYALVDAHIQSSQAITQLAADYDQSQKLGVVGSPTFLMNQGRQKLFGNIGYRLLEANVHELLHNTQADEASWC